MSEPVVTVSAEWLRSVLKKAKMVWPKELKEEVPVQACQHVWSRNSTVVFCVKCGKIKE